MKLKYLWPSQRGHLHTGKWSGRAAVIATALVMSVALAGEGSASVIPGPHAKPSRASSAGILNPPAHQMAELDFLLGPHKCLSAPYPDGFRLTVYETTRKVLDGNYYQMVITFTIPGAPGPYKANWTFGWDPVDLNYLAQYFDNVGITGNETSAGWQDGHFKFLGQWVNVETPGGVSGVAKGSRVTAQDDFVALGPGHYIDYTSALIDGQWISTPANDCQKIGTEHQ